MQLKSPSPIAEFSESLVSKIESQILKACTQGQKRVAAFDADGTLWDTDIGEMFFEYQIKHCHLPNMPADPFQHYLDLKEVNRIQAYYWLAQINTGQTLAQVRAWSEKALANFGAVPIFASQRRLIKFLRKNSFEIYVITASVKWAVEPAAALLGIDRDHVLGMHTEIIEGLITDRPLPPATYLDGKADALLKATGGIAPIFCAGNTRGDSALLNCASSVRLAVRTQRAAPVGQNHLLDDELALQKEALAKAWLTHEFRGD